MKLVDFLRPLMRLSPRQSVRALGFLGAGYPNDAQWASVSPRYRTYFDHDLQAIMSVDLSIWCGRSCYYWRRYYDTGHQTLLRRLLRPGDTYIDIGANLGFHSIYARRLIGPAGTLVCCEPHPETFAILSGHLAINRITNCRLFNVAFSDAVSEARLNQLETHSGTSTLRETGGAMKTIPVPVQRGDDALDGVSFTGRAVLKVDVEGFEQKTLAGLERTLRRVAAAVVEVTPQWIAQQGGSADELYRFMEAQGFVAYAPQIEWKLGLFASGLRMNRADKPPANQHDVCFIRAELAAELAGG